MVMVANFPSIEGGCNCNAYEMPRRALLKIFLSLPKYDGN